MMLALYRGRAEKLKCKKEIIMKKLMALLLTGCMLAASLVGCGSKEATAEPDADVAVEEAATEEPTTEEAATEEAAEAESDLAYVKEKGVLVVGITDFAPMDYKDEAGEWIGFDADMAKGFAEKLGVEVEFVEIDWDNKILELDGKTVDCIWNGMTLTDEVKAAMDCSNAYCNNAQVVIVPADKAADYQTVDSLEGLAFAVEAGSAGEKEVTALGLDCTPVKAQSDALMEVAAGTSDAAVIDSLMAAAMVGEGTSYADLTYTVFSETEVSGSIHLPTEKTIQFNVFVPTVAEIIAVPGFLAVTVPLLRSK